MKIIVFQSDKGDCLLVEGNDSHRVLVDGGMPKTYSEHVAPYLDKLRRKKKKLDVVYVSHIDEDHISGILQMMDDAIEWQIHRFQTTVGGNPKAKKPDVLQPPQIDCIWHNAFHEQVKDNSGKIEDMLAATVSVLAGGDTQKFIEMAKFHQNVATSIKQAINLSRRIGEKQLNIKLNPQSEGKLMQLRKKGGNPPPAIAIGNMKWFIIGPTPTDLEELKKEWNEWLKENQEAITRIEDVSRRTERDLGNSLATEINKIVGPASAQSEMLAFNLLEKIKENAGTENLGATAGKVLGKRKKVTVPNLASLMFMVEEKDASGKVKTVLLTGDGHHEDILKGLELQKKIKKNEPLHVDVFKVQHHGSEHNIDREFCKRIIADHYIFCGNGAHENPDLEVVEAILDSRLSDEHKSVHPKVNQPFKFWFNSSSANKDTEEKNNEHMKKVEDLVKTRQASNKTRLKFFFLQGSSFELKL
jgi:Metallo-beta-lactamase superfamily